MESLINMLRGVVRVQVQGRFPERLVNLCAQQGIVFWGADWQDAHTVTLSLHARQLSAFRSLGERAGCTMEVVGGRGLPFFLRRFRRRYAFLAGLALSLLCVCLLSQVVLYVEVEGNETVSTAEILGELRRLGLRPGVYGPGLELKQMAQEALLDLKELSWLTINLHGTRAQVIVREAVQPPEIVSESGWSSVVSEADGIVLRIEPHRGEALVKAGDTIAKGDVLISGTVTMRPPQYSDLPLRYYQTRARGKVWARTWRTLEAKIPLTAQMKDYDGGKQTCCALNFFGRHMVFYRNSSISGSFYDKITDVYPLHIPGGGLLPVSLVRERVRSYQVRSVQIDREAAQELLERELSARLAALVGEDAAVDTVQYSARVSGGWLSVCLSAECREEVGREVPADGADLPP